MRHRGKSFANVTKKVSRINWGGGDARVKSFTNLNLGTRTFSDLGKFYVVSTKLEINHPRVSNTRIFIVSLKLLLEDYYLSSFPFVH